MTTGPCYIKIIENAKCRIGDKVFMNHNCSITCAKEITIGGNCNLANNIVIVDHDHNIGDTGVVAGLNSKLIYIGNNVWIGVGLLLLHLLACQFPINVYRTNNKMLGTIMPKLA